MLNKGPQFDKEDKAVSVCPICRTKYHLDDASILESSDNIYLLFKTCNNCNGSIVAAVFYTEAGMSSVALVTDLLKEDIVRLRGGNRLSTDDVLDFCNLLIEYK